MKSSMAFRRDISSLYFSLSAKPGDFGNTLYNHYFEVYSIPAIYKALAIQNLNHLHSFLDVFELTPSFKGCSISMPYKNEVYNRYNRQLTPKVSPQYNSYNTLIKEQDGTISGYSTDVSIYKAFHESFSSSITNILIYGTGAMGTMASNYFQSQGIQSFLYARHELASIHQQLELHANNKLAVVNATPAHPSALSIVPSKHLYLLDLPVRYDSITLRHPHIFSGLRATCYQFIHQFYLQFRIKLRIEDVLLLSHQYFAND